jgi:hypothetical protein|tara:strand:- start:565 stop:786 length:222 start_codon:yes stop_codon:yes gene_type:complete
MKFVLAFSICSAVTGFCNNTMVVDKKFDTWTECVIGGSQLTIQYAKKMEENINKDKLYISYFCNENISDKTPT